MDFPRVSPPPPPLPFMDASLVFSLSNAVKSSPTLVVFILPTAGTSSFGHWISYSSQTFLENQRPKFSCPGTTVRLMNPMTYSINNHNGGKAVGLHIKILLPGVVLGSRGPSEQPTYSRLTSFLPIREIPELIKTRPRLLHVSHPPWGDMRVCTLAKSSQLLFCCLTQGKESCRWNSLVSILRNCRP